MAIPKLSDERAANIRTRAQFSHDAATIPENKALNAASSAIVRRFFIVYSIGLRQLCLVLLLKSLESS